MKLQTVICKKSLLPFLLVLILLCTQTSLQFYVFNGVNNIVLAVEEENEVNSKPLIEEVQFLVSLQQFYAFKITQSNNFFSGYLTKFYTNPNQRIFSPPPNASMNS